MDDDTKLKEEPKEDKENEIVEGCEYWLRKKDEYMYGKVIVILEEKVKNSMNNILKKAMVGRGSQFFWLSRG